MSSSPSDQPSSPDLRRSVGEATDRIHEIINAAERVATEIRTDAEADARTYLAERRAEADRSAEERHAAFDRMTRNVTDAAGHFKRQAERMLAELDAAIADARANLDRGGARSAIDDEPPRVTEAPRATQAPRSESLLGLESLDTLRPERDLFPVDPPPRERPTRKPAGLEPLPSSEPGDDPFELPPLDRDALLRDRPAPDRDRPAVAVSAYPGSGEGSWSAGSPSAGSDQTSEALLRATQLAVTGKDRDEIAHVLRADFPGVDAEPLLDEILG